MGFSNPETELDQIASQIASETIETWEGHVRSGLSPLVETHQDSLPKLAAAGLSYDEQLVAEYLLGLLDDENPWVRRQAVEVARRIGADKSGVIQVLSQCLGDEEPSIRRKATKALGEIAPDDLGVIHLLLRRLNDENLWVRGGPHGLSGRLLPTTRRP